MYDAAYSGSSALSPPVYGGSHSGPTAKELLSGPRAGLRTCTYSPGSGVVR